VRKVSELTGAELDYWVAKAEGWSFFASRHRQWHVTEPSGEEHYLDWPEPFDSKTGKKNEDPPAWSIIHECGFAPSTDWSQGGPIIEREWIQLVYGYWPYEKELGGGIGQKMQAWRAFIGELVCSLSYEDSTELDYGDHSKFGPTPLIAAMRAYVASRYGDSVEDN
jgi:hypothetical protein